MPVEACSVAAILAARREQVFEEVWIHGRFAIEHVPDPTVEGFEIEISNGVQPI